MKKNLIKLQKKTMKAMSLTGKRKRLNEGPLRNKCLQERDRFMLKNKGDFVRIFPPENGDVPKSYGSFLEKAAQLYRSFTGVDNFMPIPYSLNEYSGLNIINKKNILSTMLYGYSDKKIVKTKMVKVKKRKGK